jgi:hypothetical protein
MKITSSQRHWIANGVASIVFLSCAIIAIYYITSDPRIRIALAALSIVVLLMCLYSWQERESGKQNTSFWIWFAVFGVVWTFVGNGIGALIYRVSYFGLLTFQSATWKAVGWMGPLAIGPLFVVIGLVSIVRKVILNLLNNKLSKKTYTG